MRSATLNNRVQDFIVAHPQLFIDRELIDATSGKTIKTVNPATHVARPAFDDGPWSRMTPFERLRRAARRSTVRGT